MIIYEIVGGLVIAALLGLGIVKYLEIKNVNIKSKGKRK